MALSFNEVKSFVEEISSFLTTEINDTQAKSDYCQDKPTERIFESKKTPKISIENYIERIITYSHIDKPSFIAMFIYLDRFAERCSLSIKNIHKIIISSMLCAIKYCNDDIFPNTFYAKIGGISLEEINMLEICFYNKLSFNFFVSSNEYSKYEKLIFMKCS